MRGADSQAIDICICLICSKEEWKGKIVRDFFSKDENNLVGKKLITHITGSDFKIPDNSVIVS